MTKSKLLVILVLMVVLSLMPAVRAGASDEFQGCGPGYWKNHTDSWPLPPPGGDYYIVKSLLNDYYIVKNDAGDYYIVKQGSSGDWDAFAPLKARGPGSELLRHAAAALLNHFSPDVDYSLTLAEVVDYIIAGDAAPLVEANEQFCPLN
jgi:hypothetical protein